MLLVIGKVLPVFFFPLGFALFTSALALIALLIGKRAIALFIGICSWLWLFAASTAPLSHALLAPLERPYHAAAQLKNLPDSVTAIVLLGGATVPAIPPRQGPETNLFGDRLLHAARLYQQGRAPHLVTTGGRIQWIRQADGSEAQDYRHLLVELFGIDSTAVHPCPGSQNTREDAVETRKLFEARGWSKEILLVTSAFHMRRSAALFRKQGFSVHEAPTDFMADSDFRLTAFSLLPSEGALEITYLAVHEWMGYLAYKVLGWV